ncbi:TRAP transporter large permease subunit [Ponticoccus alexandrii]|uniref:TRAP transporter large permease subunit n=1 Tax=Ponticoccus alexandrii TaxID=1943633 RepID=A0ABX7FG49_9RHOB|nr:TRAP transporter large permease subunit [Ponticoccus alexandrii]
MRLLRLKSSATLPVKMLPIYDILVDSARGSAAGGIVIGTSLILNWIIASENIPAALASAIEGVDISPLMFLIMVNVLVLLPGCLLDATTIILVIVRLFIPPYGILLFVINAVSGIPLRDIVREVLPFLAVLLAALPALILFPGIVLFLPRVFGYED